MAKYFQSGINTLVEGMNQNVDPSLVKETQYPMGVNISSRGGKLQTRPPFVEYNISGLPSTGLFQGAFKYHLDSGDRIVVAISGHIYSFRLGDSSAQDHGLLLSPDKEGYYFVQADRYLIIQDGICVPCPGYWVTNHSQANWPVIFRGEVILDQSALPERERVPKGGPMAYGHGRLFVSTPWVYDEDAGAFSANLGNVGFVASDIIKGYRPEDVLKFTENIYLNGGGRITLPQELGTIHAMAFQKNVMNGIGSGPLIVAAERGLCAFSVNNPRETIANIQAGWQDVDFGVVMYSGDDDVGSYASRSFINVNSEILYRSVDGIRGMRRTATETQGGSLENEPISAEIRDIMALDDRDAQFYSSMASSNNRVFTTVCREGDYFKGLAVLDAAPIASMTQPSPAIWDGIYTGYDFEQVLSAIYRGRERLFAFIEGNKLIYLDEDSLQDTLQDNGTQSIMSRVYTREEIYQRPFNKKKIEYIEVFFAEVVGELEISTYWRCDRFPYWSKLSTGTVNAGTAGYSRMKKRMTPLVPDPSDENRLLDAGYGIQYCIQWSGSAKLLGARMVVTMDGADEYDMMCDAQTAIDFTPTSNTVELDDFNDYEVL